MWNAGILDIILGISCLASWLCSCLLLGSCRILVDPSVRLGSLSLVPFTTLRTHQAMRHQACLGGLWTVRSDAFRVTIMQ